MEKVKIVVCGATGTQGGAVLQNALKHPQWEVVALSRNPEGEQAGMIKRQGATVKKGDLDDRQSLAEAYRGADYVFGVTQPWSPDYKKCHPEQEVRQGKNIVEACLTNGVKHLVMSSAAHVVEGRTGIPHVDSKLDVEEYVQASGLSYTFLRPAQFMDNVGASFFPVKKGVIRGFIAGQVRVPYIATHDIGAIAALVFDNPDPFSGKALDLVGDFISGHELAETLSRIRGGEKFRYQAVPGILMRLFAKEFYIMRKAFEDFGKPPYREDIQELIKECRAIYPGLMSMEQHLLSRGFDKIRR
ncbi:MAG: NmrA/HSCARG family protein [Thermodesulfobacteriota bacterium]